MGELVPDIDFDHAVVNPDGSRLLVWHYARGLFVIYQIETRTKIYQIEDWRMVLRSYSDDMHLLLFRRPNDRQSTVLHLVEFDNGQMFLQQASHLDLDFCQIAIFRNIRGQSHLQTVEGEGNAALKVYQLEHPKKAKAKSRCLVM